MWGGVGGGGDAIVRRGRHHRFIAPPPSPTLPHKGGGSRPCAWRGCALHDARPSLRHRARILPPARAIAAQRLETLCEIDVVAAETALGQDDGDLGGERGRTVRRGVDHHAREPRRQRQVSQPSAVRGDAAGAVDRAELGEQRLGLCQRRCRRRVEEGERGGIGDAPMGEVEHEAGQIGGDDLRPVGGIERSGLRLVPQAVADAGLRAPGTPAPLVGGSARHPHRVEPGQAHVGLVARDARQPGIDHHPHAFDGEGRLGDRGREHDLAPARKRRRDRPVLHVGLQRAIERHDVDCPIGDLLAQQSLGTADLGGAGKKDQQRARLAAQRARDGIGDLTFDLRARVAPEIARLDRKSATHALDHRRLAEELADPRAVERRRHHQELEILAQSLLRVARERQAEIAVERALVELVEQHGGDAGERGIVEDETREHALGHHLDASCTRDFRAEAHTVADRHPHRLAQGRGHARRRGTRGEPAWLEHENFFPAAHGSAASTSGTRVDLPAPGGATSTAALPARKAAVNPGSTASIGRTCIGPLIGGAFSTACVAGTGNEDTSA